MHGPIHIDALIIFMLLAGLMTMLLKYVFNKFVKWVRHIVWMKRRAHGTLVTDAEAAYWLKLIDRPDYKPVWRWFYAEEWRKKHTPDGKPKEKKRRSLARKLGYLNVALAIIIGSLLLLSVTTGQGWSPFEFPTQTRIAVDAVTNATLRYEAEAVVVFEAQRYPAPAAVIGFLITLSRTDSALADRDVLFNLQSGNTTKAIDGNATTVNYIKGAVYIFGNTAVYVNSSDPANNQFGLPLTVGRNPVTFILLLSVIDYSGISDDEMASMKSTGGIVTVLLKTPDLYENPYGRY